MFISTEWVYGLWQSIKKIWWLPRTVDSIVCSWWANRKSSDNNNNSKMSHTQWSIAKFYLCCFLWVVVVVVVVFFCSFHKKTTQMREDNVVFMRFSSTVLFFPPEICVLYISIPFMPSTKAAQSDLLSNTGIFPGKCRLVNRSTFYLFVSTVLVLVLFSIIMMIMVHIKPLH